MQNFYHQHSLKGEQSTKGRTQNTETATAELLGTLTGTKQHLELKGSSTTGGQ